MRARLNNLVARYELMVKVGRIKAKKVRVGRVRGFLHGGKGKVEGGKGREG